MTRRKARSISAFRTRMLRAVYGVSVLGEHAPPDQAAGPYQLHR